MTPEAQRIARHHLGDRLHWIGRGGPHADLWIVQAWPDTGHMLSATAPTVAEAAAACAAQLRDAGWAPTHARLEWHRNQLCLVHGANVAFPAVTMAPANGEVAILIHPDISAWVYFANASAARARISAWVAANLPSLHLPPFPETPDASND